MTTSDQPEARVERTLDAPISQVWSMFVTEQHFAGWYGPPGASIPVCDFDVRTGGRRFVEMEIAPPNGEMTMFFVGEFVEIDEPVRLVYTEALADADGNVLPPDRAGMPPGSPTNTQVIVELSDLGDERTALVVRHVGIPADSPGAPGWVMALEKLADRLAT